MRRLFVLTALLFAMLLASGCAYRYRFETGLPESGREVTRWAHISGWGWATPEPFNLDEMCPEGVARFGSEITFLNWLPTFFTLGIYSPRTVTAGCAGPFTEELK